MSKHRIFYSLRAISKWDRSFEIGNGHGFPFDICIAHKRVILGIAWYLSTAIYTLYMFIWGFCLIAKRMSMDAYLGLLGNPIFSLSYGDDTLHSTAATSVANPQPQEFHQS